MIVTTTTAIDSQPVTEYVGVVTGERFSGPTSSGTCLRA